MLHQYVDDCQIYVFTGVDDAAATVDIKLAACLADVDACLKVSRLCLNTTKTQVMWLSSQQYMIYVANVSVLSSTVRIQEFNM